MKVHHLPRFEDLIGLSHEEVRGCWGLVRQMFSRIDVVVPDYGGGCLYETDETVAAATQAMGDDTWAEVDPAGGLFAMDVLYFRGPKIAHVGLVVSSRLMVHTRKETGVILESFCKTPWKNMIDGAFRLV